MQNEVDARTEGNTEVMRKIAMVGAVTPASVLAEAIAPVTTPTLETDVETHRRAWLRASATNGLDVSGHLSDYSEITAVQGSRAQQVMFRTVPVKEIKFSHFTP
jgi:hypothetical protein